MNIEKEVRYKIDKSIISEILNKTEPLKPRIEMLDITFGYNKFDSLSNYGFICRVRQTVDKSTLEVKKRNSSDTDWTEQEIKLTSLSDGINFLKLINMQPYMYLKRFREVRKFGNLKIFIDEIDVLGNYMEIEYQDSNNGKYECSQFLNAINLSDAKPQALYGDIIKNNLTTNKDFETEYLNGLHSILKQFAL